MCVLMLRGAQTPGELKQRTERMHAFSDLAGVHAALETLIGRELVARLERRPGHKEERYIQLLQDEDEAQAAASLAPGVVPASAPAPGVVPAASEGHVHANESRELESLRERVARLEREVAELRDAMRNPVYEHQP
jgi:uncharacterized protein YceH (UPF0502 family)